MQNPTGTHVHLLASQGDCYEKMRQVRAALQHRAKQKEQQRETRQAAAASSSQDHYVPSEPRAPRPKQSQADKAADLAVEGSAFIDTSSGGPSIEQMNLKGAGIPLVDTDRLQQLQAEMSVVAEAVVLAMEHARIVAEANVEPEVVDVVESLIHRLEQPSVDAAAASSTSQQQQQQQAQPPPLWQPHATSKRLAPNKKKGIPHANTPLERLME